MGRAAVVLLAVVVVVAGLAFGVREVIRGHGTTTSTTSRPRVFHPPVPLSANSSYTRTRVLSSGDLRVTHWIRSSQQIYRLTLVVPKVRTSGAPIRAHDVEVFANGRRVDGADSVTSAPTRYELFGADTVHLSYVLSGAVERRGSTPGRALALATSLELDYGQQPTRSTRVIEGARALALACSGTGPAAVPRPCGAPDGRDWRVVLGGASSADRVTAQLDLGSG